MCTIVLNTYDSSSTMRRNYIFSVPILCWNLKRNVTECNVCCQRKIFLGRISIFVKKCQKSQPTHGRVNMVSWVLLSVQCANLLSYLADYPLIYLLFIGGGMWGFWCGQIHFEGHRKGWALKWQRAKRVPFGPKKCISMAFSRYTYCF